MAVRAHGSEWRNKGAWQDTKGGFNPDVFNDVDDATRQRLRDHQIGPAMMRGDKNAGGLIGTLNAGSWSDGRHAEANFATDLAAGYYRDGDYDKSVKRRTNRGNVQNAVWEAGFANIGNKDQLNQFLDRVDSVKAKHGDFLKEGWTPEAQMLMREKPQQEQAPAAEPIVKEPEAKPDLPPAEDSDHLKQAKERAQVWEQKKQTEQAPTQTSYDKRRFTQEKKQYDFTNSNIDGDTKNV